MCETLKRAEILHVLMCGDYTMSVIFSTPVPHFVVLGVQDGGYTWKITLYSLFLSHVSEHVILGFVVVVIVADILSSSSGIIVAKPVHRMHVRVFFTGKWHIYSYVLLFA
jgi:hypothetical protein